MKQTLAGLIALAGAALSANNASAGNFCGISEWQEEQVASSALAQLRDAGAYQCNGTHCSLPYSVVSEMESFSGYDFDSRVMFQGRAEGIGARNLFDNVVVVNRDTLEALHYTARRFSFSKSHPDFNLDSYLAHVASAANGNYGIMEPCAFSPSADCGFDESLATTYENSLVAVVLSNQFAHDVYGHYHDAVCNQIPDLNAPVVVPTPVVAPGPVYVPRPVPPPVVAPGPVYAPPPVYVPGPVYAPPPVYVPLRNPPPPVIVGPSPVPPPAVVPGPPPPRVVPRKDYGYATSFDAYYTASVILNVVPTLNDELAADTYSIDALASTCRQGYDNNGNVLRSCELEPNAILLYLKLENTGNMQYSYERYLAARGSLSSRGYDVGYIESEF